MRTTRPPVSRFVACLAAFLSLPALAVEPVQALRAGLEAAPSTPHVAMACAPAETVLTTIGKAMAEGGTGGLDVGAQALIGALTRPGGLAELGIDPQGALRLQLWDPRGEVRGELVLPFAGDADAAFRMMEGLGMSPTPVAGQAGSWTTQEGDTESLVRLEGGELHMAFDGAAPASTPLPPVDLPLIEGLPRAPGCAAWVALAPGDLPTPAPLRPATGIALAGFIPFERGNIGVLRFRLAGPAPLALGRKDVAPVTGTSSQPPSLVFSLGLSAADLLQDPTVQKALKLGPSQVRRATHYLNIGPGATVAAFGDPRSLDFVAMLPLDPQWGPTQPGPVSRRLRRMARKSGLTLVYKTPERLVVQGPKGLLHVELRQGRVVLATDPGRAVEAADGQGVPWVGAGDLSWALDWPVSVWTGAGGPSSGPIAISARAGLRAEPEGVMEVGIEVQTNAPPGLIGSMLSALMAQTGGKAGPGLEAQGPYAPADVERDLEGIAQALESHKAQHGSYLELPAAPRAPEELGAEPVGWRAVGPWRRLRWSPASDPTLASFRVELSADGAAYTIFAELDGDGDGQRALFLRDSAGVVQQASPVGTW